MSDEIRIFLCGDVMLARGVDMTQKFSCNPRLFEGNSLNAHDYVNLAERTNGPLPPKEQRPLGYVWGDALKIFEEKKPDLRIINLETSVTTSTNRCRDKAIHYKMHPGNVNLLTHAHINCCVLSNNHTADWGFDGLTETLNTLKSANVGYAGAGHDRKEVDTPCILEVENKGRVLIFAMGHWSSGVPREWQATSERCGVQVLPLNEDTVKKFQTLIKEKRRDRDIVILSIHWGGNWGFELEPGFKEFAHRLIDVAGFDIVHGHSSHHVKALEVYNGKLIMYGCGDFINDYEGIGGYEEYRGDLALMYFLSVNAETGNLSHLRMIPTTMYKLQVKKLSSKRDIDRLYNIMLRECKIYGGNICVENNEFILKW